MSDSQIEFRIISDNDVPVLLRQMRLLYETDGDPFDESATERTLKAFLRAPQAGLGWVILVGGYPAGYMILTFGFSLEFYGRDATLDEIYLEAPFRGRGIGRKALAYLEGQARALGVKALHLEVMRDNEPAQRLYAGIGFENRERYFLMSKRL